MDGGVGDWNGWQSIQRLVRDAMSQDQPVPKELTVSSWWYHSCNSSWEWALKDGEGVATG